MGWGRDLSAVKQMKPLASQPKLGGRNKAAATALSRQHHRRQGKPKAERGTLHSSTFLSLVPDPWCPEIVILSLVAVNLSIPIESLHCPCVLSVDASVPLSQPLICLPTRMSHRHFPLPR